MSRKHIELRIRTAQAVADASPCPRGRVGCVLFDPCGWASVSDGYNGAPRGGGRLCGGDQCNRDQQGIESGTRCEVGCHHAEANALMNASRRGISTYGTWCAVTRDPCLMCAKLLHHAGVMRVYAPEGVSDGCEYLKKHGVIVKTEPEP